MENVKDRAVDKEFRYTGELDLDPKIKKLVIKARKKPIEIEAVQFSGDNGIEILCWAKSNGMLKFFPGRRRIEISALDCVMVASPDDYIIKNKVTGEIYSCTPHIFKENYEIHPN